MKSRITLPAVVASALLTLPVQAQDKIEELIVTSSRIEMPLRQVGTSVSVLSGEEIEAMGFNSMIEVLRSQPAIGVSNNGGPGKVSTLRIRGEEGYRTLVLMDGIDLSDTSAIQFAPPMDQMLSAAIGRVEILRGPQGLMYGADAGGVVSISSTAPSGGFTGDISAEGGRYGTRQYTGSFGYGGESADAVLSLTDYQTDGFNARSDGRVPGDDDGYDNTTVHGTAGWDLGEQWRLEAAVRDVDSSGDFDNCGFPRTDICASEFEQQAWRSSARYQGERFSHELAYSESETERSSFSDNIFSHGGEGSLEKWHYLGSFDGGDALRLVYGAELRSDAREDSGLSQERDQEGFFLEYQGSARDQLFFTAGVRRDHNDDFGKHDTWRVSGAYLIPVSGGEFKLRGAYGTGFRAPSLFEIAYNNGPWGNGVALDAEESEGYDLALSWQGDSGLYLEAVYFDQRIDQEIYFDLVNYAGYLQGRGETSSEGVELIAEWPLASGLLLSGNYTYNDTETSDGEPRARRPEHMANLGVSWRGWDRRLRLGLNARLSRDAVDVDSLPLDDYQVLDINASLALLPGLELFGRVENLLDEDYEEVRHYNTSGAAAYAGVRYTF